MNFSLFIIKNSFKALNEYRDVMPTVLVIFNAFWLIQTSACILYCAFKRRLLPIVRVESEHFAIKQLFLMLITNALLYAIQLLMIDNWIYSFNNCLHHLLAIAIFIQTIYESNIISVIYCLPYLFHTLYWSIGHSNVTLFVYNFFLFVSSILMLVYCKKVITFKIPLFGSILLQINLFWYLYGDDLRLFEINREKLIESVILAITAATPFNILFYFNFKIKRTIA